MDYEKLEELVLNTLVEEGTLDGGVEVPSRIAKRAVDAVIFHLHGLGYQIIPLEIKTLDEVEKERGQEG